MISTAPIERAPFYRARSGSKEIVGAPADSHFFASASIMLRITVMIFSADIFFPSILTFPSNSSVGVDCPLIRSPQRGPSSNALPVFHWRVHLQRPWGRVPLL